MDATAPIRRRGRPPGRSDTHAATRERLLRAGVAALTEQGFLGTGLDAILKDASVPKGSFYYYFDSKEALGLALIDSYADYFNAKLDKWLTDRDAPPLERVENFVADAAAGMMRHDFRRGCLIGNLTQEFSSVPESLQLALQNVMREWERRLAVCLAELDAGRAQIWATFFWIGWEGAVLRARMERSSHPLDIFSNGFFALVRGEPSPFDQTADASPAF
ncbi:transcriptional regulator [Acetobacter nitrogenifigens DSM 23921 = NBRC 105050]|uniref:TetR family transcriptional regulator n=1 Tax=Acetobacter nitrogenifigens DSM 23921 = NBRC 105050 TaxID=1120919 RepID=A0A511X8D5_9PROT|nr:TetR/AcrR family transcriptional regulator [Acetobacter nitrogenifigens]GBQ89662.1 transcriptional regulator [Acetobacter nitrogenifigens DSM 23921 = NBRC 105050]GEN59205.1 TetR family transcriptional regulator [Acetobacter nitrogenifigens DSM 23921 = NBRC 105050]